jgi:signal transduction histidine kinase
MNAVIGLSDLLLESRLDPTDKAHVRTINESARSLLGILNDILDFTKIDAQKVTLSPVAFDLRRLAVLGGRDAATPGRWPARWSCR